MNSETNSVNNNQCTGRTALWTGLRARRLILHLLLFTSGMCGISYEVLYGRILSNIIGDQFRVSSAILLTFLLGIGLGNRYAHRFWRKLWLIEAGIGVYALLFIMNVEAVEATIYGLLPNIGVNTVTSLLVAIGLLCVPSFLIGASLAIFAGYFHRLQPDRSYFSTSYGVYNFGAASTVLIIELWLIRQVGISQAMLYMGALNLLVSGCLIVVFRDVSRTTESKPNLAPVYARHILISLVLCSIGSAIFQLIALRVSEMLIGPFRETFAYVLCTILLGIAIGSTLVTRFAIKFTSLLVVNIAALLWTLSVLTWVMELYSSLYPQAAVTYWHLVLLKFSCIALITLVPAITFGATVPALLFEFGTKDCRSDSPFAENGGAARESGYLLFVSSIANAIGFLLMCLYLHERFDYGVLLLIVALLTGLSLFVFSGKWNKLCYVGATLIASCGLSFNTLWKEELLYLGYHTFHSTEAFHKRRGSYDYSRSFKSQQDVFSITKIGKVPYFFINGYVSIPLDAPSERLVGAIGAVFSPDNDSALVLGVGSGATGSTVGLLFDQTEAIEINKVVLDNLFRMKEYNFDIENMRNVDLYHDDAIHYLKTSEKKYSLILNTVTSPLYFSSSKLYTADFLHEVGKRLKPGGLYVTWIDSRLGDPGIDIMLETITRSFEHCGVAQLTASYLLLLGSDEPIVAHQPHIVSEHEVLGEAFRTRYHLDPDRIAYQLLHTDVTALLAPSGARVNTLDFPVLEFEMAKVRYKSIENLQGRIVSNLSLDDVGGAFSTFRWDPVEMLKAQYDVAGENLYFQQWKNLVREQAGLFPPEYLEFSAMYRQGMDRLQAQDYKNALSYFERAAEIDNEKFGLHVLVGKCYENIEQYDKALEAYRRELELHPYAQEIRLDIGRMLIKQKDYRHAVFELQRIPAAVANQSASVCYHLGRALERSGRTDEAASYYAKALRIDPSLKMAQEALERWDRR